MLVGLLTALLIFVSVVLIVLVVALQHGNEGGIGSAFGGGNSAGFFGASGGVSLIVRATWIFGAAFFGLSTALAWVKTHEKFGVTRELDSALLATPAPGVVPAATPAGTPSAAVEPATQPGQTPGSISTPAAAAPVGEALQSPVPPVPAAAPAP